MLFSLILPVYGVEKYIERCIVSCCTQSRIEPSEYEMIIVDDSSPDGSIDIAKNVLSRYPEVNSRIIRRPNGGLSAARNTGLDNAKGDFIWFIDSDDFISPDSLYHLKTILKQHPNLDVINFGHRNVYTNHTHECPAPAELHDRVHSGIEYIQRTAFYSAWGRIYRRLFIQKWKMRFVEGILWEDGEFNLRILPMSDEQFTSSAILYNYLRRHDSISTSNKVKKTLESNIFKFRALHNWIEEHDFCADAIRILNMRNNEAIIFCLAGIPQLSAESQKEIYSSLNCLKSMIKQSFRNSASSLHKYILRMILLCPKLMANLFHYRMQRIIKNELNK